MSDANPPIVVAQFDAWLAGFKSGRAGSWTIEFGMEPTEKNQAFRVTDCEGVRLTVMVLVDSGAVGLMSAPPPLELEAAEIVRPSPTTPTMPAGWDLERDAMTDPHPIPPHPHPIRKAPPRNPAQIIAEANARIGRAPTTPTPAATTPPTITPQ